jgi:hypothetical protein
LTGNPAEYNTQEQDYKRAKQFNNFKLNDMDISENADKNHEELWPGYQSKAKQTDPEFIEVFDNFAFDEVIRYGNLDTKTRVMMKQVV